MNATQGGKNQDINLFQIFPKLNTFLHCQFDQFFKIHCDQNLIWAKFGITVMLSGLIHITGSIRYTSNQKKVKKIKMLDKKIWLAHPGIELRPPEDTKTIRYLSIKI